MIIDRSLQLKYYDESKYSLRQFLPEGRKEYVRFFVDKATGKSIPSRSSISARRDPFMVPPEIQILIDSASEYGSKVDKNIEDFVTGQIKGTSGLMEETKRTLENISGQGMIWADRSVMICHPDGIASGEIDELLYHPETETYFVGDTKTSSSVGKIGYAWQIGLYVEILRELNPGVKIAPIGLINHVKYKYFKWVKDNSAVESEPTAEKVTPSHPRYNAMWSKGATLGMPELTNNAIIEFDLEASMPFIFGDGTTIDLSISKIIQYELKFLKAIKETYPDKVQQAKLLDVIDEVLNQEGYDDTLDMLRMIDSEIARMYIALQDNTQIYVKGERVKNV